MVIDILSSNGARLAVDRMNRKGGALGRPVRLVMADGESKPAVIAKKTAELLEKHPSVSALMGLSDIDMVMASAPVGSRIPSKSVTILQIERGQRQLVRTLVPARMPPP